MELDLIVKILVIVVLFGITLLIATYSTYAERKVAAWIQDRSGPNRAGPLGLLQPIADAGKMFFKEEFIPAHSNKWLFIAGPALAMLTALMSSAVIPFGKSIMIGDKYYPLVAIDVNIGVLYIFGIVSLGVYGIMIGGWASNNKFSLLGALRAASQNISYELAMGLSIVAVLMMYGTLSLSEITLKQTGFNWTIFYQPLGFILFLICAFAECNRTPFDLPECETELVGGYHTEYSSMKLGFYLFSEYINMFVSSALMATLYFGGYSYPGWHIVYSVVTDYFGHTVGHNVYVLIGTAVLFAKIFFGIFFFMWVRWTLPRFRYDQLMDLGWKGLIPTAIFNVILTGGAILAQEYFQFKGLYFIIYYAGVALLVIGGLSWSFINYRSKASLVSAQF